MEQLLSRNKSFFCIAAAILMSALMMNTVIGATTGLWRLNETSGTSAADSSGYSPTDNLTVSAGLTWTSGRVSNALQFSGDISKYAASTNYTNNAKLKTAQGSIEFWMKATYSNNPMDIIYFSRGGGYCWTDYMQIRRNDIGQIDVLIEEGDVAKVAISSGTKIADTEWHHIAVSQDGTGVKIYIDGVQSAVSGTNSAYWTNHLTTITDCRIGGGYWYSYDGLLDEVKVCNAALTAAEICTDFESGELTGNWHFNSNTNDSSIYANNGSLVNLNPAIWVDGISDKALTFDGTGYVQCTSNNSLKSSQGTIEFWMKAAQTDSWQDIILLGQGNYSDYLVIRRDNYGAICVVIKVGNDYKVSNYTATAINDTNWHHVAVTQDGTGVKIYIDGTQSVVSGTNSAYWTNSFTNNSISDCRFGGGYWFTYTGLLDEVKVHYRALNSAEVNTAFEKGALAGNWRLNSNANDSSIYANNGSLVNLSPATWVNGTVGKALTFNGTGYVQCTSNNSLKSPQGTIEFWMKAAAAGYWYDLVLFGQNNYTNYLVVRRDNYGAICVTINSGGNSVVSIWSTTTINDTNWHHIVVTQDGTNVKVYIDGAQSTVSGTNSSAYWTNHFTISDFRISGGYWSQNYAGLLDEVKVYKNALGGVEIAARYENQGAANGFGCESNPTGDPIGGGVGYSDIKSTGNYIVYNKAQLLSALSSASSGNIIYIPDNVTIDLTGESGLTIPAGVTLASDRGFSSSLNGALLYSNTMNVCPLFIGRNGARITGLRINGPNFDVGDINTPVSCGIYSEYSLEVDNCEIAGWTTGILFEGGNEPRSNYVHHNYIHHIRQYNLGYGIYVSCTAVLVEANIFDYYRHAISGYGAPGAALEARYNLIYPNGLGLQSFDMHGETDYRQNYVSAIWRLDEGYGTTTQNSALCYSPSPTETLVSMGASCWTDGIVGKALQFSGGSSHVQCTSKAGMKSSLGSIEFWMKAAAANCIYDIIYLGDDGSTANYLVIRRDPYGRICVVIRSGNIERVSIYTNTAINDTNWHHIVATQDGTNVKVYIDGVQSTVGGTNSSAYWTNQGTLADCRLSGGNKYWYSYAGLLDEVRIYSQALTATDAALHNTYKNMDYCADYINIHHNTFMATDTDSWTSINIRGIPGQSAAVHNNWFYQSSGTVAVHQWYATGNMSTYLNLFTTERILEQ